jgi:hypothetical protein
VSNVSEAQDGERQRCHAQDVQVDVLVMDNPDGKPLDSSARPHEPMLMHPERATQRERTATSWVETI